MVSDRQLFLNKIAQTSPAPLMLEIESANGVFLYDKHGKPFFDLISGVNVSSVGHNHPNVVEAVKRQVDKHMHLMVYGELIQSSQLMYADLLTEFLPESLNSVYFLNSGSEAIEGAMKLAKRFTGRSEILSFRNAYHGSTHGALSIMGDEFFKQGYRPLLPDVRLLSYNNLEDLDKITSATACVFAEVLQAEAGMISQQNGFLKALREKCNETGTLLVFDEVQTGFGRLGTLFGFEVYNVVPDVLVLSKSFGGGMPLGAFIANRNIMEVLTYNPVLGHITTFGGHPVSCAAGKAALEIILDENLSEKSLHKEKVFREHLDNPKIKDIRGKGLMLAIELGDKKAMMDVVDKGMELGFMTDWFLFCETAFRISPPLTITEEEISEVCKLLNTAIG